MQKYDVVIIGSGLGGLQCAYILSKQGMNVCVLEKNPFPGGCLQSFKRGRNMFDSGFHYIGGIGDGEPLQRLFKYFGLMDLPWHKLDENGFDEVILNDKSYMYVNGYDYFADKMSGYFPDEASNIKRYVSFLEQVSDGIFKNFTYKQGDGIYETSLFAQSAYGYLQSVTGDKTLRNVLSGTSLKMELNRSTLPLYIFAQINGSFIKSAWRLRGSGSQIAGKLIKSIEANGGTVCMKAEVTRLVEEGRRIKQAEVVRPEGVEIIEADYFIADMHPSPALSLIEDSKIIINVYRKRINKLENTFGLFTVNIDLKDNTVPYQNRNIYIYKTDDIWRYTEYKPDNKTCALVSFKVPEEGSAFTGNIDILVPMHWQEVERWKDTKTGRRGEEYLGFKEQRAEECINLAKDYIPGLANTGNYESAISRYYTSTPLTYRDYTGTVCGSAYGIRKDYARLMTTLLSPRTPEANLYLTGQNLNLHGVLGVSMTSFLTCAEIIGMEAATRDLF
jgi:all-trans-retinol 13,14-reductase